MLPLLLQQQQQPADTYFDPSTSDGSFAAGHTHTHTRTNTHTSCVHVLCVCVCARLLFVLGARLIVLCQLSGRLKSYINARKGAKRTPPPPPQNMHARDASRVCVSRVCESCVQATRTKTVCVDRYIECCCCGAYCGTSSSPFACA